MEKYSAEFYALEPLIRQYCDTHNGFLASFLDADEPKVDDKSISEAMSIALFDNDSEGIEILNRLSALKMYERIEVVK